MCESPGTERVTGCHFSLQPAATDSLRLAAGEGWAESESEASRNKG